MKRRSFFSSLLSLAARGLALVGGGVALAGCPQPVKYGGPPLEPQPTKYGGPPPPSSQPASQPAPTVAPKVRAATKYGGRPEPKIAPEYGVRVQPPPSGFAPEYGVRRLPPASAPSKASPKKSS